MEDDVLISKMAISRMLSDKWLPKFVDVCQLSCLHERLEGKIARNSTIVIDTSLRIVNPIEPTPLGTQCYVISRQAAGYALDLSKKLPAPVDNFLFSPWFEFSKKFKVYRTDPVLVVPNNHVESDIGERARKSVQKAPFFIRHGLTRLKMDRKIKLFQRDGEKFTFIFAGISEGLGAEECIKR